MDWGIIAEAVFFFSVALIAIVITIFVFSASLLGRAVEASQRAQADLRKARKKTLAEQLRSTKIELEKVEKTGDTSNIKTTKAKIVEIEKTSKQFDKDSAAIQRSYSVFQIKQGVIYPIVFFLTAIICSGAAWSIYSYAIKYEIDNYTRVAFPILIVISVISCVCGIYRLYLSLQKIQDVALTTEEVWLNKIIEGYKVAQSEIEERKTPVIEIEFTNLLTYYTVNTNHVLDLSVKLERGYVAHKAELNILCPNIGFTLGCKTDGSKVFSQKFHLYDYPYEEYLALRVPLQDLQQPYLRIIKVDVKIPNKIGDFPFYYYIRSDETVTNYLLKEITVKSGDEPYEIEPEDIEPDDIPF
ncbi:MAG: hypothetical protein NTZ34_13755 [Chloroflexi bacterium]|nr:hypothetical protein [Chloroflexota bacterium]